MKDKLESSCLSPERDNRKSEPAVRDVRGDLIDLREALNTVPSEILLSDVDPKPERDDDLSDILDKFREDILRLSKDSKTDPNKVVTPAEAQYYRRIH